MKKDPKVYLTHVWESILAIESYIDGLEFEDFSRSQEKFDAVVRRIEIIGEAVKNLPEDFRKDHPEIPWRMIAGMRDIIVHDYFDIDNLQVWKTIKKNLPELKEFTKTYLDM